jgi:hypothetical protein
MRRITTAAAAAAIALGGLLGAAGTASADPDITPEQCLAAGGYPRMTGIEDSPDEDNDAGRIVGRCEGGQYNGHKVIFTD